VVATHANGNLRMKDIQGSPSGISAEIPRIWFETTQRVYAGAGTGTRGLSALVASAAPQIDAQIQRSIAAANAALGKLSEPLERLVERDAATIEDAVRCLKAVELAFRVDLVSALGVRLTFTASDGD
jgi:predicted lipoprotein